MDKKKVWYTYTMEYYSGLKNNDIMKFEGKWVELGKIILSEVTPIQKDKHGVYSLISGYYMERITRHSPQTQKG